MREAQNAGPEHGTVIFDGVAITIDAFLADVVYFHFHDSLVGWLYQRMPLGAWVDDRQRRQRLEDIRQSEAVSAILRRLEI